MTTKNEKKIIKKEKKTTKNIILNVGVEKEVESCLLPHLEIKMQGGNNNLKKDQKTPRVHDKETLTSNKNAQQRGDEKHQGVREEPRLKALMNKEGGT